jgi:putative Holliday junction resolvase
VRRGVRLGIDFGTVRIGVARSDPDGLLAVPVETVAAGGTPVERIHELAVDFDVLEVIVGLPKLMSGRHGKSAQLALAFAEALDEALPAVSVRSLDERLSTVESARNLAAAGRNTRRSRSVIDQAAAVMILQNALDTERQTGRPPGNCVAARGDNS